MSIKMKGLLPPDFCEVITVYQKEQNGGFTAIAVGGCKYTTKGAELAKKTDGSIDYISCARIPLGKCEVLPGDILVLGYVYDTAKKHENGEDILKKYSGKAFRAETVSFCGNHILVKG